MANTVDITKIIDGEKWAIFHVYVRGDGATGDVSKQVIIDPALICPKQKRKPMFSITEIWSSLSGFDARIEFDYLNDETGMWAIPRGNPSHMCFDSFGGLKDRSPTLDGSGKLMLSTSGLLSADCCGTVIIKVRKD